MELLAKASDICSLQSPARGFQREAAQQEDGRAPPQNCGRAKRTEQNLIVDAKPKCQDQRTEEKRNGDQADGDPDLIDGEPQPTRIASS